MSSLLINGGRHLVGETNVHGAKNSVLPLLAATLLCNGQCFLHNCPNLSDVKVTIKILSYLGCKCEYKNGTVTVDALGCNGNVIPEILMREMRSSIVFMGALVARNKSAVMSLPGGCELGPRPIDIHLDALKRLGGVVDCSNGFVSCSMPNGIIGCEIHLKFPSVGATENIILASATAKGTTIITNAAREPEIADLCLFLNKAGAKIYGYGSDTIVIEGVLKLNPIEYTVMPDRIVAATYMCAVCACMGNVRINNIKNEHLLPVSSCLSDCGCEIKKESNGLVVKCNSRMKNFDTIETQPYPGFPTDSGPLLVAASTVFKGTSVFIENIFDNRFRYVDELKRLGADIKIIGRVAVINGVKKLHSAEVFANDLRGGAALSLGALCAEGESVVRNIEYIDRGYDSFENMFLKLGADIKRIT